MKKAFKSLLENIRIKNREDISTKYKAITKILNRKYYDSDSDINNSLQVGSIGRNTAINGVSDLDMLFELPREIYSQYDNHVNNGQSQLLQAIRSLIVASYPKTDIKGDGQVVVVNFKKQRIELLPAFKQKDDSYKHPDSNDGGKWKLTNPRPEIQAINNLDSKSNGNLKRLCKMIRCWKNCVGLNINGLLIDTLCYNFISGNNDFLKKLEGDYEDLLLSFFSFLTKQKSDQSFWFAPGSNQKVYKKSNFHKKATKALKLIEEAISEGQKDNYKQIFGSFISANELKESTSLGISLIKSDQSFNDTEEFIEKLFDLDIQYNLEIDCKVKQDGFRMQLLSQITFLKAKKQLEFFISKHDVPPPYEVKWKVRNEGDQAIRRDCIRGQIVSDNGQERKNEPSVFSGPHYVECYIVKDDVCVARNKIDVQIMIQR